MRIPQIDAIQATSAVFAGVLIAAVDVMIYVAYAALVFTGPLQASIGAGVGYFLFGATIVCAIVAVTSAFPHAVGVPQDGPVVILAVAVAATVATLPADSAALMPTALATMMLTTLGTGALFVLLGVLGLGNLARYVPYPVVGGFLAGTGWLLLDGGIGLVTGRGIVTGGLPLLLRSDNVGQLMFAAAVAVLALVLMRRASSPLALPALLIMAVVGFHAALEIADIPIATARANGWLYDAIPAGSLWQPPTAAMVQSARWDLIAANAATSATLLLIALLAFLLNATGLELTAERDVDINRELKVVGGANVMSGLGAGPVGYHSLSTSVLSIRLSPLGRVSGLVMAAVFGAVLLGGGPAVSLMPTAVSAGVVIFVGLDFLVVWFYDARAQLSRGDHALVVLIGVTMGVVGVLPGVALGLALAVLKFVIEYARGTPIRRTLSGLTHHSKVERPPAHRELLVERGHQIHILQLQRFIFFGTATRLLDAVRSRIDDTDEQVPLFMILDFARVSGLDASAIASFTKLLQLTEQHGVVLVLTEVAVVMRQQLRFVRSADGGDAPWQFLADLDHGVEWCEARILANETVADDHDEQRVTHALADLVAHMTPHELAEGTQLIAQGQRPTGLYYLQCGLLTAQRQDANGRLVRLRTMRPGVFVGELSLYANAPASASVVADEPSTVLCISAAELDRLESEHPDVAVMLHRHIAALASERLLDATASISALQ